MNILQQPFPFDNTRKAALSSALIISISIFFILLTFKPFNIDELPSNIIFPVILGYVVLCFLMVIFNRLALYNILPSLFKETDWKVYKEVIWYCYNIFSIGLVNFIYSYWLGFFSLSFSDALRMLLITFLVAIFPITILIILRYNYLLNKNLKNSIVLNQELQKYHLQPIAHELNSTKEATQATQLRQVTLLSDEKNGNLVINLSQLLYIAADDNYLEVIYTQEGKIQKNILRNTLKNIEAILSNYQEIFRCHRSYLVNLQNVSNITGNSQGYRLTFEETDFEVPVARNFAKTLKEKMNTNY